jgi:tRNA threonylcarbamoyladenosine biosynthesis protein TsaB
MPSLSPLLTKHDRLLVLDAASLQVQVGLLRSGQPALWCTSPDEAGRGIFTCAQNLLTEAQLTLDAIGGFVFCEGPGSMLGIRTVAMALRTWQVLRPRPAYAYQSLAVAGHGEWVQGGRRRFSVITDARRDTWHCQPVGADGRMPALQRVATGELPAGEWMTPENFRAWAPPPRPAGVCSYDLARIFPALADGDFFCAVDAPDALQRDAPAYKKWSAQIHRAATADRK